MYRELIQSKFKQDGRHGLYVIPNLPAVKLGKILMNEKRVQSPSDVVAFHVDEGLFGDSVILFTDTKCIYKKGEFLLSELKAVQTDKKEITAVVNHLGKTTEHKMKADSEEAAHILNKVLEDIIYMDKEEELIPEELYKDFDGAELNWLKLRDEVIKTIDLLHDKFNDGKLSLLEYEEKKAELLDRL